MTRADRRTSQRHQALCRRDRGRRPFAAALRAGEVFCLLGENGAGKSTVIKILTGVETPDRRARCWSTAKSVHFASPRDAREKGIATVYQEVGTLPLMSVARNFVLAAEPQKGPRSVPPPRSRGSVADRAARACAISASAASPTANQLVGTLSGGERQALAIGRAVHFGARVLVLDEPTAALGVRESATVLKLIEQGARARRRGAVHHPQRLSRLCGRRSVHGPAPGRGACRVRKRRANHRRGDRTDGRRRGAELAAERRRTRRGEPIGRLVHRPVAGDRPAPELPRRRRCDHIGRDH